MARLMQFVPHYEHRHAPRSVRGRAARPHERRKAVRRRAADYGEPRHRRAAAARAGRPSRGDEDEVRMLQQTLDEEGHTDHVLTKLAERGINQAAGDDLLEESTRYRSRLRFLGAKDLPEAREHDIHLHNRAGEHLGTLDGFI